MSNLVYVIADPGSTHGGSLARAKQLIRGAAWAQCDAIKFQFFRAEQSPQNIETPLEWIPSLMIQAKKYGIDFFGSVWFREVVDELRRVGCERIKFAYSQKDSDLISIAQKFFPQVFVSYDVMTVPEGGQITKLYCVPQYPVQYKIDFEGLFPSRFHGFSDHTLGYRQTVEAVKQGATYVEKHLKLDKPCGVPDEKFALNPKQFKKMISEISKYVGRVK